MFLHHRVLLPAEDKEVQDRDSLGHERVFATDCRIERHQGHLQAAEFGRTGSEEIRADIGEPPKDRAGAGIRCQWGHARYLHHIFRDILKNSPVQEEDRRNLDDGQEQPEHHPEPDHVRVYMRNVRFAPAHSINHTTA